MSIPDRSTVLIALAALATASCGGKRPLAVEQLVRAQALVPALVTVEGRADDIGGADQPVSQGVGEMGKRERERIVHRTHELTTGSFRTSVRRRSRAP